MASIWLRTAEYSHDNIERRMDSAQRVLNQYLSEKEQLLITAARVLTADFGFKQAVATRDENTIKSVLINHGNRIQADMMLLLNTEGQLLQLASQTQVELDQFQNSLNRLPLRMDESQFLIANNSIYQVMVLPVKAPRLIAYSVVGFKFDQKAVDELNELTGLDLSIVRNDRILITTLNSINQASVFLGEVKEKPNQKFSELEHPLHRHRVIDFGNLNGLSVLLTASLQEENEAYYKLLYSVLFIAVMTLLVALVLARVFANSITTPLGNLLALTKKVAQGDFNLEGTKSSQSQEFNELEHAFRKMGYEISQREEKISYQARHDILTGMLNRQSMLKQISDINRKYERVALLGIDIKAFKQLNDTLGPMVGDSILKMLAGRLTRFIASHLSFHHDNESAARINNDFFLLAFPVSEGEEINQLCSLLREKIIARYDVDGMIVKLDVHLGVVDECKADDNPETLLRRVEIAVESAKLENSAIRFYKQGEDEVYLEKIAIIEDLKSVLVKDDGSLFMTYQPKMNLENRMIDKLEALIRWIDKDGNFVNPELFIDLAEKSGLIVDLTHWVVRNVVRQVSAWNENGNVLKVAINLSAQDIQHEGFIEFLIEITSEYRVSPSQITLELTERDLMDNEDQVINRLTNLKAIGFEISIDDYGIGQSSLAKLKDLPVNELKIDKSFIMTLDSSDSNQIIVKSTIDLGHKLGLKVVAEGVENKKSLQILRDFTCDHIQGFYLSKPLKSDVLADWLESYETSF